MKVNFQRLLVLAFTTLVFIVSKAQLNVQILGGDLTVCKGQTIILSDSIISGSPTSYRWKSASVTIADTTKKNTTAIADTNGIITLTTSDGSNTYVATINIFVNQLPAIKLVDDQQICCDNKSLALKDLKTIPAHNPTLGSWSCPSVPFVLSATDSFSTNIACALIQPTFDEVIIGLYYTLKDSVTGCVNQAPINITVKSLPSVFLKDNYYCQAIQEINLFDKMVITPSSPSSGTFTWNCVQCYGNSFSSMLINKGTVSLPNYWLRVDSPSYKVKNGNLDKVLLELVYTNTFGCANRDTAELSIARVSQVLFGKSAEVCYGTQAAALTDLSKVNLTGGNWSCIDSIGYRPCGELGMISGDIVNTQNSIKLASATAVPNKWRINYVHTSTGCTASGRTTLLINPGPDLSLQKPIVNSICKTALDLKLSAAPAGGAWSSVQSSAVVGDFFKPSKVNIFGVPISLFYTFTDPITRCTNKDSVSIIVDASPILKLPSDTNICRAQSLNPRFIDFNITAANSGGMLWFAIGNSSSRAFLGNVNNGDAYFTFNSATSKDTFQIGVSAEGLASCASINGAFKVITTPTSSCVLSTLDTKNEQVSIYPNPSNGKFELRNAARYDVFMHNSLGEEVNLEIQDDLIHSEVSPGIYYLRLVNKSTGLAISKKLFVN